MSLWWAASAVCAKAYHASCWRADVLQIASNVHYRYRLQAGKMNDYVTMSATMVHSPSGDHLEALLTTYG